MKKLSSPEFGATDTYSTCVNSVADGALKTKLEACLPEIADQFLGYSEKAAIAELYTIIPAARNNPNQLVIANVTKNELTKLYNNHMLKKEMPRAIYDSILVAANDSCPFCGDIGQPKTLDHYLPKARYPQFSVLPTNLVPSCRDCNTGKSASIYQTPESQILHPYFEDDCFYEEKWVTATVIHSEPVALSFHVAPPNAWDVCRKDRAETHFRDLDLAGRYSIQCVKELTCLIYQRKKSMSALSSNEFRQHLLCVSDGSPYVNHWKAVMYHALANDEVFCASNFAAIFDPEV